MNKIKIYDKKNRISTSLNLLFGIYTFYKYEGKNVHQFMCTSSDNSLSYKILSEDETRTIMLSDSGILEINKESGNKEKQFTYNPEKETFRKKLIVEVEPNKNLVIDDYTNSEGVFKRDIPIVSGK